MKKYVISMVVGLAAYAIASDYMLGVRGYSAIGGEVFFLLAPLWVLLAKLVKDSLEDLL